MESSTQDCLKFHYMGRKPTKQTYGASTIIKYKLLTTVMLGIKKNFTLHYTKLAIAALQFSDLVNMQLKQPTHRRVFKPDTTEAIDFGKEISTSILFAYLFSFKNLP